MAPAAGSPQVGAPVRPLPLHRIDRKSFEDEFPIMFKFFSERGRLNAAQLQKVQELQQRWRAGFVFWLTHDNQEIEIPEWVAVNVVVNNQTNAARSSRICMSLNHTKGYGCNRLQEGQCSYVHECALCGELDHGVFQKRPNGMYICQRLRKWYDEELRYKGAGFGDPLRHEDHLTDLAKQQRPASSKAETSPQNSPSSDSPSSTAGDEPVGGQLSAPKLQLPEAATARRSSCFSDTFEDESRTRVGSQKSSASSIVSSSQRSPALDAQLAPRCRPPAVPPPPQLPRAWQAVWSDEHNRYYYWDVKSNVTSWEAASAADTVPQDARDSCSGSTPPAYKVCVQHWYPPADDATCMRVLKGERLAVTWNDGGKSSWAYGYVADDPSQAGYFPEAVLADSHRPPIPRRAGEVCVAAEAFDPPAESDGYLSLRAGDVLRLRVATEALSAWAYVEKVALADDDARAKTGWVPEIFLSVSDDGTEVANGAGHSRSSS